MIPKSGDMLQFSISATITRFTTGIGNNRKLQLLTLLHSEGPKLFGVLAPLSVVGLILQQITGSSHMKRIPDVGAKMNDVK